MIDPNSTEDITLPGACHCGAVQFTATLKGGFAAARRCTCSICRMRGAIADHPASVVRPLLLPDSPVVIWWPGKAPQDQAADELAQLTLRRLTDAASAARPRVR